MVISERAGQAGRPVAAHRRRARSSGPTTTGGRTRRRPAERVAFGTSGHRGSSLTGSFNEAHIVATTAAIVAFRRAQGTVGPLFMGRDTHALSEPAFMTALEVLHAAGVDVRIDHLEGYTPTPAVSHAILAWNRAHPDALADGIVVTPSHNPPADGGFKYDPPSGGPADSATTSAIEEAANALLARRASTRVARSVPERARADAVRHDFLGGYVDDLPTVIDMAAIADSGLRIGVDPLGGASIAYWGAIADRHGVPLMITNLSIDPRFDFMTVDWDGQIRMDPSSPYAMARLIDMRSDFDLALGNDADADRFGVVTPSAGLMNPNHLLAAAVDYLFGGWSRLAGGRGGRQDARVVEHDRPRGRIARTRAVRGARRLQVVRGRAPRRLRGVRWRGERRAVVPASRRWRLDDRQGRHHRLPARGRDDRARPGATRASTTRR